MMLAWCMIVLTLGETPPPAAADDVFSTSVRPILQERCVHCHGPQDQQASLRLDSAAGLLAGGVSGPAAVAGNSSESRILHALRGQKDIAQMPADGPALTEDEISAITRWIESGAAVPANEEIAADARPGRDHWAFQPLAALPAPTVPAEMSPRNPVDAWVIARLMDQGIAPSQEADRATLLRRLHLDLVGLPPRVSEVAAFMADQEPDAYERQITRVLASPHYGERFGRLWLDQARYADSNGYTIDGSRSIWKYRNWVIRAINQNVPFDQFTIEQFAGDMLPAPTLEQQIATGFHRNTLRNEEGGTDPEQFRVESVVDRVETTGAVFLGLTLGCARCHDHKFDPVSQREFYQFFALLNNADEPTLEVPTDQQSKELPALQTEIDQAEKLLLQVDGTTKDRLAEWEAKLLRLGQPSMQPVAGEFSTSTSGVSATPLDDGSFLVSGESPKESSYQVAAKIPAGTVLSAITLEALVDPSLPNQGPGRASNGNFVLSEVSISVTDPATGSSQPLSLLKATADHAQNGYPVAHAIDGDPNTGWAINVDGAPGQSLNVNRAATFFVKPGPELTSEQTLTVTLTQRHESACYGLGRFRLSWTASPAETVGLPPAVWALLSAPRESRAEADQQLLEKTFAPFDAIRLPVAERVSTLHARKDQLQRAVTTTLVMQERPQPRDTFIHVRGDFLRPGARVDGNVPSVLPGLESSAPRNRLELARWLVRGDNPLTPRVTANRAWQTLFGVGLVQTENDFGLQGSPPTHPELLDHLGNLLTSNGWDTKALHRRLVQSATYRQSSVLRPDLQSADPLNHLWARQNRFRLDAELVRDAALMASRLLAREIGGPGVYPPQPEGVYRFTQQVKYWQVSTGQDRYRRGMYVYFWRSSPYPFLMTFDAPNANVACTRRERSNTPLQALTLANDPAFVELAKGLAKQVLSQTAASDEARLTMAFQTAMSRPPLPVELVRLQSYLAAQRAVFGQDATLAALAAPESEGELSSAEAAAWAAVCRVILNLDEFITRE